MHENEDRNHPAICPGCKRPHMEYRYEIKKARASQRLSNDDPKIFVIEISCPQCGYLISVVPYMPSLFAQMSCEA